MTQTTPMQDKMVEIMAGARKQADELSKTLGIKFVENADGRTFSVSAYPSYGADSFDWADIDLLHAYLIDKSRWASMAIESQEDADGRAICVFEHAAYWLVGSIKLRRSKESQ